MSRKINVEMTRAEYEEFKKWRSRVSFSFEKMDKQHFYKFIKSQVPKDLIDEEEIYQDDSLETFVESLSYCIFSNLERPNIEFDLENFDCSNDWSHVRTGWDEEHHWLAFMAGGDWEIPVFGILYSDGYRLRCYIPENGNCYNRSTMTAWQEEPKHLEGKDPKEFYDFELMMDDIESHFNLDPEKNQEKS